VVQGAQRATAGWIRIRLDSYVDPIWSSSIIAKSIANARSIADRTSPSTPPWITSGCIQTACAVSAIARRPTRLLDGSFGARKAEASGRASSAKKSTPPEEHGNAAAWLLQRVRAFVPVRHHRSHAWQPLVLNAPLLQARSAAPPLLFSYGNAGSGLRVPYRSDIAPNVASCKVYPVPASELGHPATRRLPRTSYE
jgi:hypothetical protein